MKKFCSAILMVLLTAGLSFATVASAGPFLTCDPYDATIVPVNQFYLVFDGGAEVQSPAVTGWGPANAANLWTLKYDLSTLADGNHTVKGRACIMNEVTQECSDYSAVWSFSKAKPTTPSVSFVKEGNPAKYYIKTAPYASTVMGGPPTAFNVAIDGGAVSSVDAVVDATGSYLKYEITNLPTGNHTVVLSAVNDWGASTSVSASFQRYVVVVPKGIKILR